MSENTQPPADSLQFNKAEYAARPAGVCTCSACKQPIAQTYYTLNKTILCESCSGEVQAVLIGGSKFKRAFAATAYGLLAGILGSAIWFGVRKLTGYEVGLIAILVGLMVGSAVRKGSQGRGGWFYQTMAVVLTYACIAAQYMPDIVQEFMKLHKQREVARVAHDHPAKPSAAADKKVAGNAAEEDAADDAAPAAGVRPGLLKMIFAIIFVFLVAFVIALMAPFLAGAQNIIGLLIIGFGVYQAWKINRRVPLDIAGPFQLAPIAGTATT